MHNNLTIYISKGNNEQKDSLQGELVGHSNYTLLVNGNYSIRQLIDVLLSLWYDVVDRSSRKRTVSQEQQRSGRSGDRRGVCERCHQHCGHSVLLHSCQE